MVKFPRRFLYAAAGSLLVLALSGYLFYNQEARDIRSQKHSELKAIGELKAASVSAWYRERLAEAAVLSVSPVNELLVRPFLDNTASQQTAEDIRAWLTTRLDNYGYQDAVLLDLNGKVRLSVGIDKPKLCPITPAYVKTTQQTQRPLLSGIHRAENADKPHLDLHVPLLARAAPGQGRKCIGVLLFRIDPERFLFPHIQSWPTPSRTAETLLASRDGDDVVLLNKLRHSPIPPLSKRYPVTRADVPAVQAVLGKTGIFEGNDYRGVRVLTDLRPVAGTPWFIVSKVDSDEILSDLLAHQWLTLGFVLLGVLLTGGVVLLLHNIRRRRFYEDLGIANKDRLESETRFRQLFDSMVEGFATHEIICDAAGRPVDYRFLNVNPAFERLTGLEKDAIVGRTVLEVLPATEKIWIENYGRVALGGAPMRFESASAGIGKTYDVTAFSPGKGLFAVTFLDITERKQAQAALGKANRDLTESKKDMENFLYITTHDLRTPLINIQGFSRNLAQDMKELQEALAPGPVPEETKAGALKICGERVPEALDYILLGVNKMDAMVAALLKVARLGRVQISPAPVDVNEAVKTILASLKFQLDQVGAEVEVGLLPACTADAGLVGQIFANFLDNAVKYRHPGRRLMLKVSGEVKGEGTVVYTVSDNGLGIKAAEQEKVWNIFYRGSGAGAAGAGEGIGLAMVRRMAERSGGRTWLQSEEGAGTQFFVGLPKA